MAAPGTGTAVPIHLRADEYQLVGPDDLGAAGVRALESVGPSMSIAAIGPLITVHDRHFEPRSDRCEQPHRGMEQLFYGLDGAVEHDDSDPGMGGTLRAGDLGILTEGREGMLHSEYNDEDVPARAYVLIYPADPIPEAASFEIVRDGSMPRLTPHDGVEIKVVVERGSTRLHGQIHEVAETRFEVGGALTIVLEPGEGGLLFCLDGRVQITTEDGASTVAVGIDDTILFPPAPEGRRAIVDAQAPSRVFHAVTGTGFGFRLQMPEA